jgi:hypothetical protein
MPISGETNQNFTATTNGNYAVIVDNGTCTVTSDCLAVTTLSINNNILENAISIYPNPSKNVINIELTSNFELKEIVLYDLLGKQILINATNIINIKNLFNGAYLLRIRTLNS